jgi:alkanesulfonate monooxygenase SsuD/methylene tetrahydromethanopterin reductase-like flavin-dependent oxidoreductase (luciferase family)
LRRSLLYQIGHPEAAAFEALLEEIRLGEELGLHAVWCLPSTGDDGRFEASAPEVWLSAIAARTERIRLGWGLAAMTPPGRPPIRVAEQAATLDLASHGRLDVAFLPESGPEGIDVAEIPDWDEGLRMLVDMWDAPRFSWTSPRFEVPPVDVLPKPVQRPHPPLWLAGWQADHAALAGVAGLGFLDVSGTADEGLARHREAYLEGRSQADAHDLVCEAVFAAALDLEPDERSVQRLGRWESMGIDEAVVRAGPVEGGHAEALGRIRFLASQDASVH